MIFFFFVSCFLVTSTPINTTLLTRSLATINNISFDDESNIDNHGLGISNELPSTSSCKYDYIQTIFVL